MKRALRASFREVRMSGSVPDGPVVLFANHHNYYDGYLAWLVARTVGRSPLVWMEEWDRFPFFRAMGALPFPADDPIRRAATVRHTARALGEPDAALVYFPEGRLHAPDEGLDAFEPGPLERLHHVLGRPSWVPMAIRVRWGRTATPVAEVRLGDSGGPENARQRLLDTMESSSEASTVILTGRRGPDERWSFGFLRTLFNR
ncbi:MAG: 1-acyl-sn-glycerol-3-phosphate acyltransferase [Rhodothermales bacterium]|nr:1-acyl-sn-glycerol-3-phosphate acyltransferase [Rhodothermales bacterium]